MFRSRAITNTGWLQLCFSKYYLNPAGLRWSKVSLTTIHRPLSIDHLFSFLSVSLYPSNPIHLAAFGLLMQSNEVGFRLLGYFERLQLNVFNQLLRPQLMELLGPKSI